MDLFGAPRCDSWHRRTVRTHTWSRGCLEDELRHSREQWVSISTVESAKIYFRHLSAGSCCAGVARMLGLDVLYPTHLLLQLVESTDSYSCVVSMCFRVSREELLMVTTMRPPDAASQCWRTGDGLSLNSIAGELRLQE